MKTYYLLISFLLIVASAKSLKNWLSLEISYGLSGIFLQPLMMNPEDKQCGSRYTNSHTDLPFLNSQI